MSYINSKPPLYEPSAVQPMRDELTHVGFSEMLSPQDVDNNLQNKDGKTTLVMVNSVCGCAAGSARPGVTLALQNAKIPDRITTIFAGLDRDAVDHFRFKYVPQSAPSSPSLYLFRDGKVLYEMPRFKIEGRAQEDIADELSAVFNNYCEAPGPSIPETELERLIKADICGCKIPQINR